MISSKSIHSTISTPQIKKTMAAKQSSSCGLPEYVSHQRGCRTSWALVPRVNSTEKLLISRNNPARHRMVPTAIDTRITGNLTSPDHYGYWGYGSVGAEQAFTALYSGVSVSPVLFNFTLTPQTQLIRALALKPQRNGRNDRIWTCDPLVPNQMLYQTEPHSETAKASISRQWL